ncbi:MAG: hypothetical protein R2838_02555 [Caldilineaceae bacterium]
MQQLRFTEAEGRRFSGNPGRTGTHRQGMTTKTEGWPVGLRLVHVAIQRAAARVSAPVTRIAQATVSSSYLIAESSGQGRAGHALVHVAHGRV